MEDKLTHVKLNKLGQSIKVESIAINALNNRVQMRKNKINEMIQGKRRFSPIKKNSYRLDSEIEYKNSQLIPLSEEIINGLMIDEEKILKESLVIIRTHYSKCNDNNASQLCNTEQICKRLCCLLSSRDIKIKVIKCIT
jgi:high-affinity K+ transport system ATPase subunit B